MAIKPGTVHFLRPGLKKTPAGYIPVMCGILDGNVNKSSTYKNDVTCKKCVSLISQYEFKIKKEMQLNELRKI